MLSFIFASVLLLYILFSLILVFHFFLFRSLFSPPRKLLPLRHIALQWTCVYMYVHTFYLVYAVVRSRNCGLLTAFASLSLPQFLHWLTLIAITSLFGIPLHAHFRISRLALFAQTQNRLLSNQPTDSAESFESSGRLTGWTFVCLFDFHTSGGDWELNICMYISAPLYGTRDTGKKL